MESYYNIHNIISVAIKTKRPEIIKEYEYYIRNFKVDGNISNADLTIKDLESFSLPKDSFVIEKDVSGFKSGIYNKKNAYAIVLENNKIILYVKDSNICLNTLIEYFLLKRGATFLHGAAISYKDKGIIFPAPPNTGKTILISKMRNKENVKFFGDDYVFVGNGNLYAYPSDFSIYKYHFDFFPELKNTSANIKIKKAFFERALVVVIRALPIKKAIKRFANMIGYDYLMGGEYLKVPAKNLILSEKFGSKIGLTYSVFLQKYDGEDFKVEKTSSQAIALEMVDILKSEWQDTLPALYLLSKTAVFNVDAFFQNIHGSLNGELANIQLYKVFLPVRMSNEERIDKLEKFLEKEIFVKI